MADFKLYKTRRWQRERSKFLKRHPICAFCQVKRSTRIDHIIPHKGNESRFWDINNWQSLCTHCHESDKKKIESSPRSGCDVSGHPTDIDHPWNSGTNKNE